jgi:hypothetical protein
MDELVEYWTVLDDELELVAGKRGAARLGFALLLKHYRRHGHFPQGRAEFPDKVVALPRHWPPAAGHHWRPHTARITLATASSTAARSSEPVPLSAIATTD